MKQDAELDMVGSTRSNEEFSDPLLDCLVIITRLKQNPFSHEALRAGLPLTCHRLTPELFIRASQRAGLSAKLFKRKLTKISPLLLPAVLLLNNNKACVVTDIDSERNAYVIFPEVDEGISKIPLKQLEKEYTGYVFFTQTLHQFESRSEASSDEKKGSPSWFWGTIWRFRRYYYQVIVASIFINIFALAVPLYIKHVYNRVIPNNATETLLFLSVGAIIVFLFDFLMRTIRGYLIDLAGKKVDVVIASNLFEQVLGVKTYAAPASTGVQANHLRDFENIRDFFTSATISGLVDLPFILLFIAVIYLIGGLISLVLVVAVPLVIIASYLISLPLKKAVEKTFVGGAQKHAILVEALSNLDVIKSTSAEGTMQSRWEKHVGISSKSAMYSRFYSTLAMNISVFTQYLVTVLVVIFGVYAVAAGNLQVGGLIAITILSGRAMAPLGQLASLMIRYQLTKCSYQALSNIMKLPIERPRRHKFLHRPTFAGAIEFEDLRFRYEGQSIDLFKNISFRINAGEKVGIVGPMGAGKTSLFELLMNFYVPAGGAIRIDGTDIAQIDPADLRRQIGYVQQESKLFYGTARDNITMKAPWASDEEILRAARISGADNFISKHPLGYDLPIGENGKGLSGGQCQTIAIARSLLMSPSILLFDEPTSSMDNSTENRFIKRIKTIYQDKTLLLVTHKMSLLKLVDRLIILQCGKIIADGKKEKVLESLRQLQKKI